MKNAGNSFVTFISGAALLNMQRPPRVYASKVTLLGPACLQIQVQVQVQVQVQMEVTKKAGGKALKGCWRQQQQQQ